MAPAKKTASKTPAPASSKKKAPVPAKPSAKAAGPKVSKLASIKSALLNMTSGGKHAAAKGVPAKAPAKAEAKPAKGVKAAPTKPSAAPAAGKPAAALTVKTKGKGKGKAAAQEPGHRMAGPSIRVSYDANGEAVCREVACENLATSAGYCRMHYIKNWKKIKRKDGILREGKLNQYIEELVAKYPDKYIEAIRQDLAADKDFAKVIYDLDLDESVDEFEGEGESMEGVIDTIKRDFDDEGETGF